MRLFVRRLSVVVFTACSLVLALPAAAQHNHPPQPANDPPREEGGTPAEQPGAAHLHQDHTAHAAGLFATRDASGTAWLPVASPMYGVHRQVGPWEVMAHGNAFVQVLSESGARGGTQAGSINWLMGMARRPAGSGWFGLRGMISLEPFTIAGCGYPDLLATGEFCEGAAIRDKQHPHDLFMELAAEYDAPLNESLRWRVYGGPAGEPALGPPAYPHRISALPNPIAPISHHWFDATHIAFGVLTGGVYGAQWKGEASLFNGREPDEYRTDLDLGALDSFSGRFWFAPRADLVLQVSAGHLREAEAGHDGVGPRVDVNRVTASATWHPPLRIDGVWASTLAWGRNTEEGQSSDALLLESTLMLAERDAWFGRLEISGKPAHDLDLHGTDDVFTVTKAQAGYARYFGAWQGLKPGIGAYASVGIVPSRLESLYGDRANLGLGVFVTLRPVAHQGP